jgi:hypothetical protein
MKNLQFICFVLLVFLFQLELKSQTVFFEEDFENGGTIPINWTNIFVSSNLNWRYENGGYSTNPSIPNSRRPPAAYEGSYNALFEKSTLTSTITKLVTPTIDLSLAIKPELHFWYANYTRTILSAENDELRIYYRSVDEEPYSWILLAEYIESMEEWTEGIVQIPDSVRFTNVQLAFEGTVGPGWGMCVDDISIIETGIIPKYLESIKAVQASTNTVPTGSINNPILRIDFTVKGNDGNLFIDTLVVDALMESALVVPEKGIRIYFSTTNYFSNENPVGDSLKFENGKAIFTDLGINLPFGYSYLWITYNVPVDTTHTLNGLKLDAKVSKDNIIVNGLKYPFADLNPSGTRTINESVVFDDFEDTDSWTLVEEFEIDQPSGIGGAFGTPDPEYAQNGNKVLGTDLTGKGLVHGDYENDLMDNHCTATIEAFSCKYFKDVSLQFYRWLNVENSDSAKIQIDLNNSGNWNTVWHNTSLINDSKWSQKAYSLENTADRTDQVALRYVVGPTNNTWTFSGWNVDDFAVTGTFIHTDAGVIAWVLPDAGCGHIAPEPITVTLKNFGYDATNDTIPIGFSTDDGSSWTVDTLFASLPKDSTYDFTFTSLVDLTNPGNNRVLVKTFLSGDQDDRNDQFDTTLYILPTLFLPYAEDFEEGDGFWKSGGNNTWQYGDPAGAVLNEPASGDYCWATQLANNYPDNDSSWIESPCLVFSSVEKPIFEVKIQSQTEVGKDGLALLYSLDEGATWELVPGTDPYNWNWYSGAIESLGTQGWDSITPGWWMARQTLPSELTGAELVKFRLVFASNDSINDEGFLIDDIRIYEAPADAGITAIINPGTACYLTDAEDVQVTIENFGIRDFKTTDPLIASLKVNNSLVVTDTFYVASNVIPGNSVNFTFSEPVNMRDSGQYDFVVYTHIPGDSNIYSAGVANDTLISAIRVNGMPDYNLGPNIGTNQPDTVQLDAGAGFAIYLWHDASTNRYFDVDTAGMFFVSVTNSYDCLAIDSIEIMGSTTDLAVTQILGISGGCVNTLTPALEVTLLNNGDTTYHIGDTLQVGYKINNQTPVVETITLASSLANGSTINYEFVQQPDFDIVGVKDISCYSVFEPELNYRNDTTYTSIEVYPNPELDLGQDTLYTDVASPIILDAGAGFASYDWQDNSTNQTFSVTDKKSLKYYVEVADVHSCGTASDTVWVFSDSWELDSILNPTDACAHTVAETVQVRLRNLSENPYPAGFVIPAQITFNNAVYNENIILTATVNSLADFDYDLSQTFDFSQPGNYSISVKILPQYDLSLNDNSQSKGFETYGIYFVDLGYDTIITKQADTVLLDAGNLFNSYSWSTGAISQTIQIPNAASQEYKVTVTDAHFCQTSTDSVTILASDLGIEEIYTPFSQCELSNTNKISFLLVNNGQDIIPAGTGMSAYYQLNNGGWVEKPFNLPYDLAPDNTKTINLSENLSFESGQSYDFGLRIDYNNDFFPENDTIYTSIFEFENPSVNIGPDIYTTQPDTVIIQAQPGYANYQWQDFSKLDHYNVTNPASATYHVLVNNAYGCTDADTLKIFTYDLIVADVLGDENDCDPAISRTVQIGVSVSSADTLQAGHEMEVSYQCNGISATETFILAESMYKTKTLYYPFTVPLEINSAGDYNFTASVSMDNEVKTDNNGFARIIHTGTDSVHLGEDIVTYNESVVLDAGPGFTNYTWNDNSHNQTLEVTETGDYSVTTTDSYGCTDTDSIHLFFVLPTYDVIDILGLADSCIRESVTDFSFVLKNNGNDTIHADSIIDIQYTVNSGNPVVDAFTFVSAFEPGDEVEIPFETSAQLMQAGTYLMEVSVTIGSRTSALDTTIHTWGLPNIPLPADTTTYEGSLLLDAGAGFASYLWGNDSITQSIPVTQDGDYSVTVTNEHGCANTTTVSVLFLKPGYAILSIEGLKDSCLHAVDEQINFVLSNTGNDTLSADSTIIIQFQLNESNSVAEDYTFTQPLAPGGEVEIAFETTVDLSEEGTYVLEVKAIIGSIETLLDTTIHTWGLPEVDLGEDIESDDDQVILDAGEGFASYLWNTGASSQTITVTVAGEYWVQVMNEHGCGNSDTLNVAFVPFKVEITDFIQPLFGCDSLYHEEVTIEITNTGTRTLNSGTQLVLSYQADESDVVDETVELASDMTPGKNLIYNFANLLTLTESGEHTLKFFIGLGEEEMDAAEYSIPVYAAPEFFEGADTIEVTAFPYQLAPQVEADAYIWNTGATTETISVTANGTYTVTITQTNTCEFSDSVYVKNITHVHQWWASGIRVYPNPADATVSIVFPESIGALTIQVTDLQGKLMYQAETTSRPAQIDVTAWPQGTYLLQIGVGGEFEVYQMVKK